MQDFYLKYNLVKDSQWMDCRPKSAYSFMDNDGHTNNILSVYDSQNNEKIKKKNKRKIILPIIDK